MKKIPGLTCRCVLASVDVKRKGENERSFELFLLIEGSLEVKLPTIWTDGKVEGGKSQRGGRRAEERRSEKRKSQKKEDAGARKGRKVAKHCVFPMNFVAPEGRQVGSLKRRVRSHLAR